MKNNKFNKIIEPYLIAFFIVFITLALISICADLKKNLGNFIFTAGIVPQLYFLQHIYLHL